MTMTKRERNEIIVALKNMLEQVSDFAILEQEEMIATTIAGYVHDRQMMRDNGHPDCLACRIKLSLIDGAINDLRNMFREAEA